MEVKISPSGSYRTQLPIEVSFDGEPSDFEVRLEGVGAFPIEKRAGMARSYLWVKKPGSYELKVKDIKTKSLVFSKELKFEQQEYLSFSREFGAFSALFTVLILGVALWHRKKMTRN